MRQGEIANCLNRHTPESCIFPIQGGGIHVDTMGAANAFRIYRSILAEDPGDHEGSLVAQRFCYGPGRVSGLSTGKISSASKQICQCL